MKREEQARVHRWTVVQIALVAISIALPVLLVVSAVRGYRAVDQMRLVYLKNRAVSIALQLESLSGDVDALKSLAESEFDVASVQLFDKPLPGSNPDAAQVNSILAGQALFYAEEIRPVYRSYLPIHSASEEGGFHVAKIETYSEAADFLVQDANRDLTLTFLAAFGALATLAAYLILVRRNNRLRRMAELGTMSAALAHEIRNPLGTIKGFVQLASEESGDTAKSYLQTALDEIRRLERLVHDLLLFARPRKLNFGRVEWSDIVTRLELPAAQPVFQPADGLAVYSDADSLVEILANLIRNACEAAPGGEVTVSASLEGRLARILVEDNGPGIDPGIRRRVFEPFFSTKSSGTGLGLAICLSLARQINAELELTPRTPMGTTARLAIPAILPDAQSVVR